MEKLDRLKKRLETLDKALNNLEKAIKIYGGSPKTLESYDMLRESVIKRFEYTLELFWKLLKSYLEEKEGLIVPASPRGVISEAGQLELISQNQVTILNNMIDDRNMSSHVYHEDVAIKIANDVLKYYPVLKDIRDKISKNLN